MGASLLAADLVVRIGLQPVSVLLSVSLIDFMGIVKSFSVGLLFLLLVNHCRGILWV